MNQSTGCFTPGTKLTRRYPGFLTLAVLACLLTSSLIAQDKDRWRGKCAQSDGVAPGCSGSGSSGGNDRLTSADIEAQKKYAEWLAYKENQKGVEEFKKGNYARALKHFEKATEYGSNTGYEQYIAEAAQHLGIQHHEDAQHKLASIDASVSNHVAESQHKTQANVSALEQKAQGILSQNTVTAQQGTNFFGSIGPGKKPTLTIVTVPSEHANSALEQAGAMAKSGDVAAKMANDKTSDPDIFRAISGCGSDTSLCARPDHLEYAHPAQSTAAIELSNRIPDRAKDNPIIRQRLNDLDRAALHRQGIEQTIAEVEQKIKANDPNAAALKVYETDLVSRAAQDKQQEEQAKAAIKNQLDNLGLDWVEEVPKTAPKASSENTAKQN